MPNKQTTAKATDRHEQSETLDLLVRHCPGLAEMSLSLIEEAIGFHTLQEWQLTVPVGTYLVSLLAWESSKQPPFVSYQQVMEFDEAVALDHGIQRKEAYWHYMRPTRSIGPIEETGKNDVTFVAPHDFHFILTEAQVEYFRFLEFPTDYPTFISAFAECMRKEGYAEGVTSLVKNNP